MTITYDKDGVALYTVPARFTHLEYPTGAKLTQLSAGILASYERLFQRAIHQGTYQGASRLSVYHRWDYLIYRTPDVDDAQPRLVPLSGDIGDDITLSESRNRYTSFDLRTVEWLTPGMVYKLIDVAGAFEDLTELLYA